MKKLNRAVILAAVVALNLIPVAAFGASTINDLSSLQELKDTFKDFQVGIERSRSSQAAATLFGMVYKDCADKFKISNSEQDTTLGARDSSIGPNLILGFRITDVNGAGRACVAKFKGAACGTEVDGKKVECERLSSLPGATLNLAGATERNPIRLFVSDTNSDKNREKLVDIGFEDHLGVNAVARIEEERKANEKKLAIEKAIKAVKTCRRDTDQLTIARQNLEMLKDIGAVAEGEVTKFEKELAAAELKLFSKKVADCKNGKGEADADMIREEVAAFATQHPELAEKAADMMLHVAGCYLRLNKEKTALLDAEGFDKAESAIEEAKLIGLEGLDDKKAAAHESRMERAKLELRVHQLQLMAQSGLGEGAENLPFQVTPFGKVYVETMKKLYENVQAACHPRKGNLEACATARAAYAKAEATANAARQTTMQAFNQQQQQEIEKQRQMGAIMNGQSTTGQQPMHAPTMPGQVPVAGQGQVQGQPQVAPQQQMQPQTSGVLMPSPRAAYINGYFGG